MLFGRAAALKAEVTATFYRTALARREACAARPAAEVQTFIDAEHAEATFDPKYHGLYDDRFVKPGDVPVEPLSAAELASWLADWPPAALEQQVGQYRDRQREHQLLYGLKSGQLAPKGKTIPFRDQQCTLQDVDRLLTQVEGEMDAQLEAFYQLDQKVFLAHWSIARHLDAAGSGARHAPELVNRYRFHSGLQGLLQGMLGEKSRFDAIVGYLVQNPQLEEGDFNEICNSLRTIQDTLNTNLNNARSWRTPALTNVAEGTELYELIVDRGDTELPSLHASELTGEWVDKLGARVHGVLSRLQRVHYKSLGSLLAFQDKLVQQWHAHV